jgi:hypothetical protein
MVPKKYMRTEPRPPTSLLENSQLYSKKTKKVDTENNNQNSDEDGSISQNSFLQRNRKYTPNIVFTIANGPK